jgi:hypothetical protein
MITEKINNNVNSEENIITNPLGSSRKSHVTAPNTFGTTLFGT